jgi:hypothetical protein
VRQNSPQDRVSRLARAACRLAPGALPARGSPPGRNPGVRLAAALLVAAVRHRAGFGGLCRHPASDGT